MTAAQIEELVALRTSGATERSLAARFGVSRKRLRRTLAPHMLGIPVAPRRTPTVRSNEQRMARFTSPEPMSGCWLWAGAIDSEDGYGWFWFRRGGSAATSYNERAHRAAWILAHGSEPAMQVLHRCDNRACVNPDHLFLGTHRDNMTDRDRKGRTRHGSFQRIR